MKPYTLVGLGAAFLLAAAVMRADTTVSSGTTAQQTANTGAIMGRHGITGGPAGSNGK